MGLALALEPQTPGWQAELSLGCEAVPEPGELPAKSVIRQRRRAGPLALQRVLYPEGPSPCHAIVLHPPGGVAGGDLLEVSVRVAEGAALFGTTPASTKFYKSGGRRAASVQRLEVAAGGCLEWFPQETLVFEAAEATLHTEVELREGAAFAGWEIVCLGRQHMGERFRSGHILQTWSVDSLATVGGRRRLLHERFDLQAQDPLRDAAWGLAGRRVFGSLVLSCGRPETEGRIRAALEAPGEGTLLALTRRSGLIVVRALADAPRDVRGAFEIAWGMWRESERGLAAHRPRIWNT